jgi:dihydrofolate reductase
LKPTIIVIAAVAQNGAIGKDNQLLWRIPADLQRLRKLTTGWPVVMGRKTWDSLPERFRPLPGRHNIVVTRQRDWSGAGATVAHGFDEAMAAAGDAERVFVLGGADLYAAAVPQADELELTEVQADSDGDVHFPAWDRSQFIEASRERHQGEPPNSFAFDFVRYIRK